MERVVRSRVTLLEAVLGKATASEPSARQGMTVTVSSSAMMACVPRRAKCRPRLRALATLCRREDLLQNDTPPLFVKFYTIALAKFFKFPTASSRDRETIVAALSTW